MTRKLLLSLAVSLTLPLFTSACVAADKAAAPVLQKAQWPFAAGKLFMNRPHGQPTPILTLPHGEKDPRRRCFGGARTTRAGDRRHRRRTLLAGLRTRR